MGSGSRDMQMSQKTDTEAEPAAAVPTGAKAEAAGRRDSRCNWLNRKGQQQAAVYRY